MAFEDAMDVTKMLRNNESDDERIFKAFGEGRKDRCEKIVAEGRGRSKGKM